MCLSRKDPTITTLPVKGYVCVAPGPGGLKYPIWMVESSWLRRDIWMVESYRPRKWYKASLQDLPICVHTTYLGGFHVFTNLEDAITWSKEAAPPITEEVWECQVRGLLTGGWQRIRDAEVPVVVVRERRLTRLMVTRYGKRKQ